MYIVDKRSDVQNFNYVVINFTHRPTCLCLHLYSVPSLLKQIKQNSLSIDQPPMCVISHARLTFLLLWPWRKPDDLDIWNWSRSFIRCTCILKMKFVGQDVQTWDRKQDISSHIILLVWFVVTQNYNNNTGITKNLLKITC